MKHEFGVKISIVFKGDSVFFLNCPYKLKSVGIHLIDNGMRAAETGVLSVTARQAVVVIAST